MAQTVASPEETSKTDPWRGRHRLTSAEGMLGASTSAKNRKGLTRYLAKVQKKMLAMGIEGDIVKELISFGKTIAITPVGSIIVAWFIIDFAQKTGYIGEVEALALKEVVTGAEVLSALGGGQGLGAVLGGVSKLAA